MLKAKLTRFTTAPEFPCHYQATPNPAFKLFIFVRHSAQIYFLKFCTSWSARGKIETISLTRLKADQPLVHPWRHQSHFALQVCQSCPHRPFRLLGTALPCAIPLLQVEAHNECQTAWKRLLSITSRAYYEIGILPDNNTEATSLTCTAAGLLVCNIFIMCQEWCNFSTVQNKRIGNCLAQSLTM